MTEFVVVPEEKLKILRDKRMLYNRKLRDFLDVTFSVGDDVEIEGDDNFAVLRAKEVIKAFARGFSFNDALDLVAEDYILDVMTTTDYAGKSRNRQEVMRGRVIGSEGKSKAIIEKYSGAKIAVSGKTVSIIGRWENVALAKEAVEMLLRGAKHTTVFKMLEERKIV